MQRATGQLDTAFTSFGLTYTPPEPQATGAPEGVADALTDELAEPLGTRM